jgi:hypothetical protein
MDSGVPWLVEEVADADGDVVAPDLDVTNLTPDVA